MIIAKNSTGRPVLLNPVPGRGRWRMQDDVYAIFVGVATGRHMNHILTCPSRAQAERIYSAAEEMLR